MEHTQANPKTHTCGMCGYEWLHGQHGGHDCATRLKAQRDELLAGLETVTSVYESVRRTMADLHPLDGWSAQTMTIDAARALIAKHKEASHG